MALKLIDPVYSQMPFFQPNQVLTYGHLNDLAGYLYQQERYTRNKLMGTGIVCGLSFSWTAAGSNALVLIDEGCAITSAGYLIVFKQPVKGGAVVPFSHKRVFSRLKDVDPFKDVPNIANVTAYELITQDEFDSETIAVKSVLSNTDKNAMVLMMLFDLQALNVAKCLDESCDDKGKLYDFTPRPILVPASVADAILDAVSSKPYATEAGRGHKGRDSVLHQHNYLYLKSLFRVGNLQEVDTPSELADIFKYPCEDDVLTAYKQTIDNVISKFPWIFSTQVDCMKGEVPLLATQSLGTIFFNKARAFRIAAANKNYVQYLYGHLRDVVDAFNEMLTSIFDLVGECGGNEATHPFHVLLGKPQTNDTLACYKEEKYNEQNFKYRSYFVPSPIVSGQFMLYEQTMNQFKRLVRIIANFNIDIADTTIKVIPGKDYESELGERVIPYFYANSAIESLRRVWNYGLTKRNKLSLIRGYQLPIITEDLMKFDTARGKFFRIEGHIGKVGAVAKSEIDALRNLYNLPFSVSTVSVQQGTTTTTCSFPDLEEEYSYYTDRASGYLREVLYWMDGVREMLDDVDSAQAFLKYYDQVLTSIKEMQEYLKEKCIDKFNYNGYKKSYVSIWNVLFEIYYTAQKENISSALQSFNASVNLVSIIFFSPIYKIWYMYKYRMAVINEGEVTSLKLLAKSVPGAEHIAGVMRGETFLMVTDQAQGGKVIADFSLPAMPNGNCDCNAAPCDGTKSAAVSPLQKPIIMVVDYSSTAEVDLPRTKAVFNAEEGTYELEMDSMGFYKGGSSITQKVKIFDSKEKEFLKLKGTWNNEKLLLSCAGGAINDGAYILSYEMSGGFDEHKVRGVIYLFVRGKAKVSGGSYSVTHTVTSSYTAYYPYEKETVSKVEMKFAGDVKKRTIGNAEYEVFTTPLGNEVGITKGGGKAFMKMITTKQPGAETVPVILKMDGASVQEDVVINVVSRSGKLDNDTFAGVIKDDKGNVMRDVRVTNGKDEVITDAEGRFEMAGLKAGELLTVEKAGYKAYNVQVSNGMRSEISMRKDNSTVAIPGMERIKLPDFGSLAKGFNTVNIDIKTNEKK
jgi:hypothetical protein